MARRLSDRLIAGVAAILERCFTHTEIDNAFIACGAPPDSPGGNKLVKITNWLRSADEDPHVDVYAVLGCVLSRVMDGDTYNYKLLEHREAVRRALAPDGLTYETGGRIIGGSVTTPTKTLNDFIRERDLTALELEFRRAVENVDRDPPAAVTAASSILESTCKVIIEHEQLPMPRDQSIQPLWKVVRDHLKLVPSKAHGTELNQVLGGLTSIIQGVGGLHSRGGSAHGHDSAVGTVEPRHARLAVHAAHTLVVFILESWRPSGGTP